MSAPSLDIEILFFLYLSRHLDVKRYA